MFFGMFSPDRGNLHSCSNNALWHHIAYSSPIKCCCESSTWIRDPVSAEIFVSDCVSQLATYFEASRSLFCQVQSGPPSSKTQCLKTRKPAVTRSTWGRPLSSLNAPKLHVYHAGDA